jgi:hypothetical protein
MARYATKLGFIEHDPVRDEAEVYVYAQGKPQLIAEGKGLNRAFATAHKWERDNGPRSAVRTVLPLDQPQD